MLILDEYFRRHLLAFASELFILNLQKHKIIFFFKQENKVIKLFKNRRILEAFSTWTPVISV